MKVILCPFHNDTNPSMRIYGEYSHCFVCSAHVLTSELNLPEYKPRTPPRKEPTNIAERIQYISKLPKQNIRGFNLAYDDLGYYLVWPSGNYYKRRNFTGKARYTAPSGVAQPLFVYPGSAKHLVVVEGEMNAMTLHRAVYGDFKVVSPGPASDFLRHVKYYFQFHRITLILDYDAPGIVFGLQVKEYLLKFGKHVNLILVDKDYNQILQDSGEEAVREAFERDML